MWESKGRQVTVIAYHQPVAPTEPTGVQPQPGKEFAAIEVEGCNNGAQQFSVNPFDFQLQMPDNSRLQASPGWVKPDLQHVELAKNDCARGFVTYEVPQGQTPRYVLHEMLLSGSPATKFAIQ